MNRENQADKTDFQWLEAALRKEGLLVGKLTEPDEKAVDALLAAIWKRFDQ